MKKILLSKGKGKFAIVDDEEYSFLMKFQWRVLSGKNTDYAITSVYQESKNKLGIKTKKRKDVLMHRLIVNSPDEKDVDHINGEGLDNRKQNLRLVTCSQNLRNRRVNSNNTTGKTGVYWHERDKKFIATISINGKSTVIGRFTSFEEASCEREAFEKKNGYEIRG